MTSATSAAAHASRNSHVEVRQWGIGARWSHTEPLAAINQGGLTLEGRSGQLAPRQPHESFDEFIGRVVLASEFSSLAEDRLHLLLDGDRPEPDDPYRLKQI